MSKFLRTVGLVFRYSIVKWDYGNQRNKYKNKYVQSGQLADLRIQIYFAETEEKE